jgi:hypothetical protein
VVKKRMGAEFIANMARPWLPKAWRPEPVEEYEEDGVTVKVYPPAHGDGSWSGPTAQPKRRGKKSD